MGSAQDFYRTGTGLLTHGDDVSCCREHGVASIAAIRNGEENGRIRIKLTILQTRPATSGHSRLSALPTFTSGPSTRMR